MSSTLVFSTTKVTPSGRREKNLALRNSRQSSWSLKYEVYEEGQEIKKGNGYTGYGLKKNGN